VTQLDRKLLRDLAAMRGQVITIALVIAAGVAVFVASVSTYGSLVAGCDRFYASGRFPHVFVTLKRAPLPVATQLAEIPGVAAVEPRIAKDVIVDWPSAALPVSARMVSLTRGGDEALSRLHLRRGTAPEPGNDRDAVISESFAEANGVTLGEDVRIVLNQRTQSFRITGIALSPEFTYVVKSGAPIPDDRFYAVLWVDRSAAEAAFDMKGAFNDVVASIAPGTDPKPVIDEFDRLLEPYGSTGAIARRDQPSHRFLEDELAQQKVTSITVPFIFFAMAAFLLNTTLGRVVVAQREQIGALKALGFPNGPLVRHYLKLVAVVVLAGLLLGNAGGCALGEAMIRSYHGFFRFPSLAYETSGTGVLAAALITTAAASLGVVAALQRIVALPPAVAMRPSPPLRFHHSRIEGLLPARAVSPSRIMVLRNMAGRPLRAAFTIIGIAFAVAMVVLGLFWRDALDRMIEVQFVLVERGNTTVTFPHPLDRAIVGDLAREPGVLVVEGQRIVPVRLRAGHHTYLTAVIGLQAATELRRPHDAARRPIEVAAEGLTLTRRLAERLAVATGELVTIEVTEGKRRKGDLTVSAIVDETIGMSAYMELDALNRLTGEGDVVSAAALYVDPTRLPVLSERLKVLPVVAAVSMKSYTLDSFQDKIATIVLVSAGILTGFAMIIAVGVVYNGARISLQERAWELASLRVLGFTRAEVARVLFSEYVIEIAIGLVLGLGLSEVIIELFARFHSNESFQIPAVIAPRTYAAAVAVVVVAALGSAYGVRRRIDRLDLVGVLKTRD
jgi:putative ABC transport system permease protein